MLERTRMYQQLNIMVIWFNAFNNKTYNYLDNRFDTFFHQYKLKIDKKNSLLNVSCDDKKFEDFLSLKLESTNNAKIYKVKILNCIKKEDDDFIRININNSFTNCTRIIFNHNWRGYKNGFFIQDQDELKYHIFEGIYTQGFKSIQFKFKLNFDEISNV